MECKELVDICFRSSKITGDVKSLIGLPLERVDLIGCPIKGDLNCFEGMSLTLSALKLSRTTIAGDIASLVPLVELNTLELARMPQVIGDIADLASCIALQILVLTGTSVDCDNLAKLRNVLKKCDIMSSA
mmetsp:Transcript_45351/g.58134  ORF Transcript_45351/g.58134 Transcript_45351/m.58134 type:complete len:131 (+) Transcript_45351:723-1115(+)